MQLGHDSSRVENAQEWYKDVALENATSPLMQVIQATKGRGKLTATHVIVYGLKSEINESVLGMSHPETDAD